MTEEKKLDFTAKNIAEIAERMANGTITKEELEEAAENTSNILDFIGGIFRDSV